MVNEENISKREAQMHNIQAAIRITGAVKSTLGPEGADKMLTDELGNVVVTNDGATILREVDVSHPAAKMIIQAAYAQEQECFDGTTSTVVLTGALLEQAIDLLRKGVHPNQISRRYQEYGNMSIDFITGLGEEGTYNSPDAPGDIGNLIRTTLAGKSLEPHAEHIAKLCQIAMKDAEDRGDIRIHSRPGDIGDSSVSNGILLNKEYVIPTEHGEAMMLLTGLDEKQHNENLTLQITAQEYKQLANTDELTARAKSIVEKMPDGGVILARDHVADHIAVYLAKRSIAVIRRVSESDMLTIARMFHTRMASSPDDADIIDVASFCSERINDLDYIYVESKIESQPVATIILRGATPSTVDEMERGLEDALGVAWLFFNGDSKKIIKGGGFPHANAASYLASLKDWSALDYQVAVAYADALRQIPFTIAENAGGDPLVFHNALAMIDFNEASQGVIVANGDPSIGVPEHYEPLNLVLSSIRKATEVAVAILRIDDIIGRKPADA